MKPYPIFLNNLASQKCVVIGGGREGEHKVKGLLDCEANITLIAPTATTQLEQWAEEGQIVWHKRPYQKGDLAGAFLVIAERANAEQNAQIFTEATAEKVLVNVMDDVEHCNFVAGSVVRQGKLTLSISTSGSAPALSVRLRERFEREFGPEYAIFLDWMQALRQPMAERYPGFNERRERWYQLIDSDILETLRAGKTDLARQKIVEIINIDPELLKRET